MKLSDSVDRDAWVEWQIKFVQKLRHDTLAEGWSFNFLREAFDNEFPRAYKTYIAGMKRAGNHAIISWMIHNSPESHIFFNNMITYDADLVRIFNANHISPRLIDRVICSFEHISLDFCNVEGESVWYVMRDPYNWLASWVNHTHCDNDSIERDIQVYIDNVQKSEKKILYNEWFKSREYRNSLADRLGFINNDTGINDVTNFGKGSSFDKKNYNGRARDMDVLNRWKKCVEMPLYKDLVIQHYDEFEKIANDVFAMKCPVSV